MIKSTIRAVFAAVVGCGFALLPAGGEEPKAKDAPEYVARFRTLLKEFEAADKDLDKKWEKPLEEAKADGDKKRVQEEWVAEWQRLMSRIAKSAFELAEPHAAEPPAAEVLAWVALRNGTSESGKRAIEYLVKYHAFRPESINLAYYNLNSGVPWVEPLLRTALASPELPRDRVGKVEFQLARLLMNRASFIRILNAASAEALSGYEKFSGREMIAELRKQDPAKFEDEAVALYAEIEAKYASQKGNGKSTCGELAQAALFEFRNLAEGKPVPEIEGEDSAGAKFKLADYRGRVVLIVFWASWCGPCMAQVPHERELLKLYAGKPFAIVGVNGDAERASMKAAEEKNGMTWQSFWEGPKSPISRRWNLQGWPTVYLIDHAGVIRCKQVTREAFDAKIAELVADAEKAAKKE